MLVASNEKFAPYARWLTVVLLGLQALPLLHDVLEPRRAHFSYPPYYPAVYVGMRDHANHHGNPAWMADVPAGASWYSGQCVWSQPATLHDYYAVGVDQPVYALVLSPHVLDRPFFGVLNHTVSVAGSLGEWSQVYSGLVTKRFPSGFRLIMPQNYSDNLYILWDPQVALGTGK